jgi:uncharacterized protein
MGHRNSSSHVHDADGLCGNGGRAAGAAAGVASQNVTANKVTTSKKSWRRGPAGAALGTKNRTTYSSLHGRTVRKNADREANNPAISLGMTALLASSEARGSAQPAKFKVARSKRDWASRVVAWLLLAGIRFYQAIFAPAMPVGCKFYPSCSQYAAEAITRHGAARGIWLAAARLWRCRPFTKGGFDPVPDAVADMNDVFGHGVRNRAGNRVGNEVGS